eukprot:gb/GFBE01061606.1/.p1 GENE.gb/GFBE01061606.1/~~gb/GFBE01061606.1/.p1  ORF type:complete len:490 (+),score=76.60 gb/GFBE01061606.1/:1-1470(+)
MSILPAGSSFILDVPVSAQGNDTAWRIHWNTTGEPAHRLTERWKHAVEGDGLNIRLRLGDIKLHRRGNVTSLGQGRRGERFFIAWDRLPATMHELLVSATIGNPEIALEAELAPFEAPHQPYSSVPSVDAVGIFLYQSPGRSWAVLVQTFRWAFRQNLLPRARLHVLVHNWRDWQPERMSTALAEASAMLGGYHWCAGVNRYYWYNRELMDQEYWLKDNWYHKLYVMVSLATGRYKYIVSIDDDVYLNPSTWAGLLTSAPVADQKGCAVLAPMVQNNIPGVELWAESWLDEDERAELYSCFAGSSGHFCRPQYRSCGPTDDGAFAVPLPSPWNATAFYSSVAALGNLYDRIVHPVSANQTCMELALDLALKKVPEHWMQLQDHGIVKQDSAVYPYFRNNVFLSRTDFYSTVIRHKGHFGLNRDEAALSALLFERRLPLCFLKNSLAIHPAYAIHGKHVLVDLENRAQAAIRNVHFPAAQEYARQFGLTS